MKNSKQRNFVASWCQRFQPVRITGLLSLLFLIGTVFLFIACATTPVPSDPVKTGCSVSSGEVNGWFKSGSVSLNGVAKPADSVAFPDSPNCSFYKWSEQMFLWLTSPAPSEYGGGSHIFNSGAFYDVSPPDGTGQRTLIPHTSGFINSLALRAAQMGVHDLPVILDKQGRMFEIAPNSLGPNNKPLVLNEKNEQVEVDRIGTGENKQPTFLDKNGAVIQRVRPVVREDLTRKLSVENGAQARIVQKFSIGGTQAFLNLFGSVIDIDQGQAGDSGVLEAINGSLVYYATMVNDVYAYFLTGSKDSAFSPVLTQFPTTQSQLNQVVSFAGAHGKTFPDPEALAIEVKTSWVEAAGLPDLNTYITITANVPTYDKTNPNQWVPNGQKTVQLALVGIHVVGSTAGHPEMIWATFEHRKNTPNATYEYASTSGTKTVNPDFSQAYVFCAANPDQAHLNEMHMQYSSPNIVNMPGFTISPSNTIRWKAWGGAFDARPNPLDANTAASNSEIISINNDVRGFLISPDVRINYFMTGATWTIGGSAPTGQFPSGNEVGTSQLENSTMETYQQGSSNNFNAGSNCFGCHGAFQPTVTTDVSHMFAPLKPLF